MIAIIDYGLCNLLSIKRAVSMFEKDCIITKEVHDLQAADKIILPGVGAFAQGMHKLNLLQLDREIVAQARKGKAILGICLGMQMLFDSSEEGGKTVGLGLIKGKVNSIPQYDTNGLRQNVPHIGWEQLNVRTDAEYDKEILNGLGEKPEVYFVHSYEAQVENERNLVATVSYGGREIAAIVKNDNVIGCQFHPEKSGEKGLHIIHNFIKDF